MKKLILVLLILSLYLVSFSQNSTKQFSIDLSSQLNSFSNPINLIEEGEEIYMDKLSFGGDYGLGVSYKKNLYEFGLSFNYAYTSFTYFIREEYKRSVEENQTLINGDTYFYHDRYSYMKSFRFELSFQKYVDENLKYFNFFYGAGLNLIHYENFSTQSYSEIVGDTVSYVYLLANEYTNSKSENNKYNSYKPLDIGFTIYGGMDVQINHSHKFSLGIYQNWQPRYAHVIYYETTDISPFKSKGLLIQPLNTLSLRLTYTYTFDLSNNKIN